MLFEETGIEISVQNIYINYLRSGKWRKIIKRLRDKSEKQLLKHPLAQKANRLNILLTTINEALGWRLDKINYSKYGEELSRIEKRNIGVVAGLIREVRAEIEGEKGILNVIGINNNGANSGSALAEKLSNMPKGEAEDLLEKLGEVAHRLEQGNGRLLPARGSNESA